MTSASLETSNATYSIQHIMSLEIDRIIGEDLGCVLRKSIFSNLKARHRIISNTRLVRGFKLILVVKKTKFHWILNNSESLTSEILVQEITSIVSICDDCQCRMFS